MPLITDHLARCIRTLESSLTLYRQAEPESIDQEVSSSSNECSETSDIAETHSTPHRSKIFSVSQLPTAS